MESIIWRQFEKKDQEAVYDLHVRAMKLAGTYVESPESGPDLDADLKDIENIYINNNGAFYVATLEDRVVGMGAIRKINTTTAEIKRMKVEPSLQGKGIGKFILDKLIIRAKELGYKKLILDVAEKQKIAQRLYESHGFTEFKRGNLAGQETKFYELNV